MDEFPIAQIYREDIKKPTTAICINGNLYKVQKDANISIVKLVRQLYLRFPGAKLCIAKQLRSPLSDCTAFYNIYDYYDRRAQMFRYYRGYIGYDGELKSESAIFINYYKFILYCRPYGVIFI